MAEKQTTWGIKIKAEGGDSARSTAEEIAKLQKYLATTQDEVKKYGAALRNLRGSSDAVTEAKKKLKAQMTAARDSISQTTLSLTGHGAALSAAKAKTEETSVATELMGKALSSAGLAGLTAAGAIAAVAAAFVAMGAAVIGATVALASWILQSGNELRTQGLVREALAGSAEDAARMGRQIELLGTKVPQTRAELNKLYVDIRRGFDYTRISGQGIVDVFNAVGQASAAMGDQAGNQIKSLLERGKEMGRFGLGLNELQGTGINFGDVAGQLAKDLGIGLRDAQNQLKWGRVNLDAGAKAIREVVEAKFGKLNLRRMLDLNVLSAKLKDTLAGLTSGVNLDPLLEGVSKLFELFSQTTVTGQVLKGMITDFGNATAAVFKAAGPYVTTFVQAFVVEMLKFEIAALEAAIYLKEKFGIDLSKTFSDTSIAIDAAKAAFKGLEIAVVGTAAGIAFLIGYAVAFKSTVDLVRDTIKGIGKAFTDLNWTSMGKYLMQGLAAGITGGSSLVFDAIVGVAGRVKDKFKDALGIHSPSLVFAQYGRQTTEGFQRGVAEGAPAASNAVAGMIAPPAVNIKGGGGSGGNITVSATINVDAGHARNGAEVADSLNSPSFKAQFIKMLEEAMIGAGLSPQTPRGAS